MTGAKIGDTVTIDYGTEKRKCIVVAYFQSMNQLGAVIRLHEDAPTDFAHISNMAAYQINFTDDPAGSEIENRKEKIKKLLDNEDVMNAAEYCDDSMNCASAMEAVQYLFLGITLIVVVLICVLMERSFISDEKSQIAILKADRLFRPTDNQMAHRTIRVCNAYSGSACSDMLSSGNTLVDGNL